MEGQEAVIIEREFFFCNVQSPVNHLHKEGLKLVHVPQGNATERGDVLVGVVGVVEHLGGHEYRRQDQPMDKC